MYSLFKRYSNFLIAAVVLQKTTTIALNSKGYCPKMTSNNTNSTVKIFLTGDVMLGRGVDQILKYHCDPKLYEDYVKDARDYVQLAVSKNGKLPTERPVNYVWGDAVDILGMRH